MSMMPRFSGEDKSVVHETGGATAHVHAGGDDESAPAMGGVYSLEEVERRYQLFYEEHIVPMMKLIGDAIMPTMTQTLSRIATLMRVFKQFKKDALYAPKSKERMTFTEAAQSKCNAERKRHGLPRYRSRRIGEAAAVQLIDPHVL